MTNMRRTTVDAREVERFSRMSQEWWSPTGHFRALHKFNPIRLGYILENVAVHFGRDVRVAKPLKGLRVLDIGCGGGLLCEPVARLGAEMVGADASEANIEIAKLHASESGLLINYQAKTAEALADQGERFDVILNMEVVEHVANVDLFLSRCSEMLKPGGIMFVATINRTLKAFAFAIIAAERILRWLPRGTHEYHKLIRPEELEKALSLSGLTIKGRTGITYNPLSDCWRRSHDMDVNYIVIVEKLKQHQTD